MITATSGAMHRDGDLGQAIGVSSFEWWCRSVQLDLWSGIVSRCASWSNHRRWNMSCFDL